MESLFIAFDGASQIQAIMRESSACKIMKLSDFCREDSTISLDAFNSALLARRERTLVLGIGEYAALVGDWEPLHLLWSMRRDGKKFIAPVFNGYGELEKIQFNTAFRPVADPVVFLERTHNLWTYLKYAVPAQVECTGLKSILQKLETGYADTLTVKTQINLQPDRGVTIDTYGDVYKALHPDENISPYMLAEEQWQSLVEQPDLLDVSFFSASNYIQLNQKSSTNPYLRKVLAKTENHSQFRPNFINLIVEYDPQDAEFAELAAGRHELAEELDEDDICNYLFMLEKFPPEKRIRYLSPKREEEKLEILKCVSSRLELAPDCGIENIAAYMENFNMDAVNAEISGIVNRHFQTYKKAKLSNCAEILPLPQNGPQIINRLLTRNALVEKLKDTSTKLYWIDALGCEYLGFLLHYTQKKQLSMKVSLGRVNLPSITSLNKDFFESWEYEKDVIRELDDIKHGRNSHLDWEESKRWPLHLVRELEILENLVNRIAKELKNGKYKKIVVTADHGATRLAVIANDDLCWEMPEKGRHSGRCCPAGNFKDALPANIMRVDDGRWLVVTDYGRFRGSHMTSVEVHGGATLEEAIVPVLEFTANKILPAIWQITEPEIRLSPGQQTVTIEIASEKPIDQPTLHLQKLVYSMLQTGVRKYAAEIPVADLQEYNEACIYTGNDKLSPAVVFRISRGVKSNVNFDDFFG